MGPQNRIENGHEKRILLLENSSGVTRSHAERMRRDGFDVQTVFAELNLVEKISNQLSDIDLIIINTSQAFKELGGERFLDLLNKYQVPVLILSDNSELGQKLAMDRETSFNIIDHSSDTDAIDNTIQKVLKVDRSETGLQTTGVEVEKDLQFRSQSRQFFESSNKGIVFFDASTQRIHDANSAMETLTGIPMHSLIGKNIGQIKFFQRLDIDENLLDDIIKNERVHYTNCMAEQADGTQLRVSVDGEFYKSGTRSMIRCTLRPTEQDILTNQQLSNELQEKAMMIHELQHRTKNTFAMITGLVELKSLSSESDESKRMLRELAMRVQSISELYKLLHENDSGNDVNLANYCHIIIDSVLGESEGVAIKKHTDDIVLDSKKATSFGLILVELLYNIVKYAFPEGTTQKRVGVDLSRKKGGMILTVSDNGIGLPENFSIEGSGSSGLSLVCLLADQLNGDVEILSNHGTIISVEISN